MVVLFILFKERGERMIELKNINKTYQVNRRNAGFKEAVKSLFKKETIKVEALKDISFHINEGEIVGYIGPNGAGKSSTIKIMCGILTPESGSCVIDGMVPWQDRKQYVKRIGVVFGQRSQLWWDVPVIDSFALLKDIYEIEDTVYQRNIEELSELLQLKTLLRTPTRSLSLGQRMRCEIAAALLHDPKILFLDEPTIGLDAVSKVAVRSFIKKINETKKTTIILTTHDMQDIEALTSRILLIGHGQILFDGPLETLKKRYGGHKFIQVEYQSGTIPPIEGLCLIEENEQTAKLTLDQEKLSINEAIDYISTQVDILDLTIDPPFIDDIIISLYKEYQI